MSLPLDETLRHSDDCGCCEGISGETPVRVENRPGLSAIAYRVGTQPQFKETMLARLSSSRQGALRAFRTRADDDFTVALLDAWATVADVLTFYQERIANESYLRTATERFSVAELARLIGYRLRPGVAAGTYLAFTVEGAPGAAGPALNLGSSAQVVLEPPPPSAVPAGVKVQSVPGPGELPQVFETVEEIEARPEWNAISPLMARPQQLRTTMGSVVLKGSATNVQKGDTLLIVESQNARATRAVQKVTVDDAADRTRVDFETPALSPAPAPQLPAGSPSDFPTKVELNEATVAAVVSKRWKEGDLSALAETQGWSKTALTNAIDEMTSRRALTPAPGVFAFRQRAAIFGYNAPRWESLPASTHVGQKVEKFTKSGSSITSAGFEFIPAAYPPDENWEGRTLEQDAAAGGGQRTVDLDSTYPNVARESWVVLSAPLADGTRRTDIFKVKDQFEVTRTAYAVSGKISRLRVEAPTAFNSSLKIRTTSALVQSEQLTPGDVPVEEDVSGANVTLGRAYLGLKPGRTVILTGERSDLPGALASETRRLKEVSLEAGLTVLVFDRPLDHAYVRKTVRLNANVALATHGETVQEILGSGDAAKPFQSFALRQPPLTHTSAANASGAQTTLEVRVNDVLWTEVESFYGRGPDERIYVTRTDTEGKTVVTFGDGRTGARLPTGQENVSAKYRKGIGLGGLVRAHQLSLLMTRPLGVKGVTNPEAAAGADEPERLEGARENAPLTVLTLGRAVSLQDYEDFARTFAGVGKALATLVWTGENRAVHLTVAGAGGAAVAPGSELETNLIAALRRSGDPHVPLIVEPYAPRFFVLAAAVKVDPTYTADRVLAEVESRLRGGFSFEARSFGQPVSLSEVVALVQGVKGVLAVDVNEFYGADAPPAPGESRVKPRLEAKRPRPGGAQIFPAQILTLDPRPLGLEVMQ